MNELDQEIQTYERELEHLLEHEGKYVLVQGSAIISLFDTYADALRVGYEKFGDNPFMVKKIEPADETHLITRFIHPCRT